jgi:uncharacterized protein YhbP (UPF0306 family)
MESLAAVRDILASASTMTLATADAGGLVHATPVYFSIMQLEREPALWQFCFFSDGGSLHARQAKENPLAAAAIYPDSWNWQEIRGLQLRGSIRPLLLGEEWEAAWKIYSARFPFVVYLKDQVAQNTFYCLSLYWMRMIDNRQGFGFKQEWQLKEKHTDE